MTQCKVVLLIFSMGEGCFALSVHPEESPPCKDWGELRIGHYTLLCACTEQLCVWPCTLTKCLASGKKEVRRAIKPCRTLTNPAKFSIRVVTSLLLPYTSWISLYTRSGFHQSEVVFSQNVSKVSDLKVGLFFHLYNWLLCAYGMLIIPRAHGPCLTPPQIIFM